jgi:hypothetical protein
MPKAVFVIGAFEEHSGIYTAPLSNLNTAIAIAIAILNRSM